MKITLSTFTQNGPHCDEFDRLLLQAIQSKSALQINFAAGTVDIEPDRNGTTISFSEPQLDLQQCSQSVGATVFLPFIETVQSISLCFADIYSLRTHQRTIADFWARNLFDSAICSQELSLIPDYSAANEESKRFSDELGTRYLWYIRSIHDEPVLSSRSAADKIYIGSHIPTVQFSAPLFNQGLHALRRIRQIALDQPSEKHDRIKKLAEFDACRSELLKLLN